MPEFVQAFSRGEYIDIPIDNQTDNGITTMFVALQGIRIRHREVGESKWKVLAENGVIAVNIRRVVSALD